MTDRDFEVKLRLTADGTALVSTAKKAKKRLGGIGDGGKEVGGKVSAGMGIDQ